MVIRVADGDQIEVDIIIEDEVILAVEVEAEEVDGDQLGIIHNSQTIIIYKIETEEIEEELVVVEDHGEGEEDIQNLEDIVMTLHHNQTITIITNNIVQQPIIINEIYPM